MRIPFDELMSLPFDKFLEYIQYVQGNTFLGDINAIMNLLFFAFIGIAAVVILSDKIYRHRFWKRRK